MIRTVVALLFLAQQQTSFNPTVIHPIQIRKDVPIILEHLYIRSPDPSRWFLIAGPEPADTTTLGPDGNLQIYQAVIYLDSTDMLPKMKRSDGTIVILGQ